MPPPHSHSSNQGPTRVIYLGGLPYDYTEQQVLEIASSVGPVVLIKLIFDNNTGKSKGYAFVGYSEVAIAESAVRNLSKMKLGNRSLKVAFANEGSLLGNTPQGRQNQYQIRENKLPPLPSGTHLPANMLPADAITQTLGTYTAPRLATLMRDAKHMAQQNPAMMEKLLQENPQLGYALVQVGLLTNTVSSEVVAGVVAGSEPKPVPSTSVDELSPEQKEAITGVLALSETEIAAMDPEYQGVIRELRRTYQGVL
ncbi:hypothetical protein BABINDRAFT_38206 [Babjeviella inositovora NRRL Y-12698]|uniref:RRM domain-containing protein n=1 Tax=Babjeviella inositovora NRRL Y-12698 TaxID=984486 RepID=A0A1E3QNJ5_9ASCO|nr:uncharacterized protein BABINDRAFT_38206 [Babjeviella inositovora NRRL Y-12698]ODQ79255.1 hypothetical protein BABINDRAFT_38206 [Babjeviella inositovora NRRL Y-12698]